MTAKLYYSISEVSKIADEEQHILRYWEKEFALLKPRKNRAGNRIYSAKDIKVVKAIKKLLRQDKLSLKGAKERLAPLLEANATDNAFDSDMLDSGALDSNIFKAESERNKAAPDGIREAGSESSLLNKSYIEDIISLLKQISAKLKQ